MKKVFFLSLLLLGTITAAGAELRSALLPKPVKINWYIEQLTSKPGEEETYQTVTPAKVAVTHSAKTGDARTDLKITLKNNAAKPQFLRVTATAEIPFDNYRWWNGYVNDNSLKFDPADKILSTWFPANAAIAKTGSPIPGRLRSAKNLPTILSHKTVEQTNIEINRMPAKSNLPVLLRFLLGYIIPSTISGKIPKIPYTSKAALAENMSTTAPVNAGPISAPTADAVAI